MRKVRVCIGFRLPRGGSIRSWASAVVAVTCLVLGVPGRALAAAPLLASAYGGDPRDDNGPGFDPRGDITSVFASDNGAQIRLSVTTAVWDDPTSSVNWKRVQTGILWLLDTNHDGKADYVVAASGFGTAVFRNGSMNVLCVPYAVADEPLALYRVIVPTSCVGNPTTLSVMAEDSYATASTDTVDKTKSLDDTGWIGPIAPTSNTVRPDGYWMVDGSGAVYPFGTVPDQGFAGWSPAVKIEATPSARGYWVLDATGAVYAYGDAHYRGGASGLGAGEYATSMSRTTTGNGYWIFTNKGRALRFGDAASYGDMSHVVLNKPVINSVSTATGHGYYMVAADGGVFAFGDAHFHGSMGGTRLNKPVVALVPTADNRGYWLVASYGGVFAFGTARFRGSMGGTRLNKPIVGMVRFGNGYLMVGSDGGIFNFSTKPFYGSLGSTPPKVPVVAVTSST